MTVTYASSMVKGLSMLRGTERVWPPLEYWVTISILLCKKAGIDGKAHHLCGVVFQDSGHFLLFEGKSDKITYKPYGQHQAYLIPPSAEELIPQDHLVRLVSEVTDEMGIERLLRKYQAGGGASRYHPVMMTKLFVYGYMTKICSSRNLNRAAKRRRFPS
jgi:hypothetical protein